MHSIIRYVSRVRWSNPVKGVAPSPTPQGNSYWKESLLVTLDYGRKLYFYLLFPKTLAHVFIYIYIYIYIYILSSTDIYAFVCVYESWNSVDTDKQHLVNANFLPMQLSVLNLHICSLTNIDLSVIIHKSNYSTNIHIYIYISKSTEKHKFFSWFLL